MVDFDDFPVADGRWTMRVATLFAAIAASAATTGERAWAANYSAFGGAQMYVSIERTNPDGFTAGASAYSRIADRGGTVETGVPDANSVSGWTSGLSVAVDSSVPQSSLGLADAFGNIATSTISSYYSRIIMTEQVEAEARFPYNTRSSVSESATVTFPGLPNAVNGLKVGSELIPYGWSYLLSVSQESGAPSGEESATLIYTEHLTEAGVAGSADLTMDIALSCTALCTTISSLETGTLSNSLPDAQWSYTQADYKALLEEKVVANSLPQINYAEYDLPYDGNLFLPYMFIGQSNGDISLTTTMLMQVDALEPPSLSLLGFGAIAAGLAASMRGRWRAAERLASAGQRPSLSSLRA
jgi:hypothetical protein